MTTPAQLPVADVDVDAARRWVDDARAADLSRLANVLVDSSGRIGPLSYLVPDGMDLQVGDAVEVPFGKRQAFGMVLGPGDPDRATRTIDQRYGRRAQPTELAVAQLLATRHFTDPWRVAARLAPTSGKGADPATDDDATLAEDCPAAELPDLAADPDQQVRRIFAARPPSVDDAVFAARVAARVAADGQVLVLCPTVELVRRIAKLFGSGARRIDTKASEGAWKGFNAGTVRIGIGTRTAALYSAPDLAGIVVVEQDHPGHVEARMPHTHARDVALLRSEMCHVPVVLTGAVPTPEALAGGVRLRESTTPWPTIDVITREGRSGSSWLMPPELLRHLREFRSDQRTPLMLVERHRASHRCDRCRARRYHEGCQTAVGCEHRFDACPDCGSTQTRPVGWDAARLSQLFKDRVRPVTLAELAGERDAGLVVVFDAEAHWRRPSLDPDVQAAHAITTAATAAGPGGVVAVLTDDGSRPTLQTLSANSHRDLAKWLWHLARQHRLPPHGRLVTIRVGRKAQPKVAGWPGQVLGPRRVGSEWEILVRIAPGDLPRLAPHIARLRRPGKVRLTVT